MHGEKWAGETAHREVPLLTRSGHSLDIVVSIRILWVSVTLNRLQQDMVKNNRSIQCKIPYFRI
jgi:hypothetical protein